MPTIYSNATLHDRFDGDQYRSGVEVPDPVIREIHADVQTAYDAWQATTTNVNATTAERRAALIEYDQLAVEKIVTGAMHTAAELRHDAAQAAAETTLDALETALADRARWRRLSGRSYGDLSAVPLDSIRRIVSA
ncbi:hypothetical protein ITJ38_10070 [Agreia pratensis]|uniref:hypothetical protein n=1 Tax=Agreia pratensis TaxID=150121 RepID=UPI00188C9F19|nr:hypothetical protein [Agreia pratensis]MBF4634746.1 hypothetical protein [Agreia pratensis]